MLKALWERRRDDEGFTLIELMVVVLIIGILIAIALPTFLGARRRAQDRAAQSDLRNAIAAAKTLYTDTDDYSTADEVAATGLPSVEPSLDYVDNVTASASANGFAVSVAPGNVNAGDFQAWGAARMSQSGTCFYISDFAATSATIDAGTFRNSGTGACTGTLALTFNTNDGSW